MIRFGPLALALLCLALLAAPLFAHGGGHPVPYTGPRGTVPPNMQPPVGPTPPPQPPTQPPTTPTPNPNPRPTPPPRPAVTPGLTGARPVATGGSSGMPGATTTRRGGGSGAAGSFDSWEFWWAFNKERLLELKRRLHRTGPVSDTAAYFYGRRRGSTLPTDTSRPTRGFVRKNVVPALRKSLEDRNADVRDSACVALGKVGGVDEVAALSAMLKDRSQSVRKAAVLGLGLLRVKESIAPLTAVLAAKGAGSRLYDHRKVGTDVRAYAAAALGLTGDDEFGNARRALIAVSGRRTEPREVRVAAVIALANLRVPDAEKGEVVNHLAGLAAKNREDSFVRAHALVALGRQVAGARAGAHNAAVTLLMQAAKQKKRGHFRTSAVIALGLCGDKSDRREAIVDLVARIYREDKTRSARNMAAIALGRLGGEKAFKHLRKTVLRANDQTTGYAAIAMGLLCRKLRAEDGSAELIATGTAALRAGFRRVRNPGRMGGLALALGLARDQGSGATILRAMKEKRDITLRGYLALALGMIPHEPGAGYLFDLLDTSHRLPLLQQQTAVGLGLMGSRHVANRLVRSLTDGSSAYMQASAAQALGFIGDRDSIAPLLKIVGDKRAQALTRAYACVALGSIGDEAPIPALAELLADVNWMAGTRTIMELRQIM